MKLSNRKKQRLFDAINEPIVHLRLRLMIKPDGSLHPFDGTIAQLTLAIHKAVIAELERDARKVDRG